MIPSIIKLAIITYFMCILNAQAEGITVSKAESRLVEEGYEIVADFKITLPPTIEDALKRGVALNFVSDLVVTRSRWYWFDSSVIQNEQQTKLSYNALTQQYRISKGTLFQGFPDLESALRVLGRQSSKPVPIEALGGGSGYVARLLRSEAKFTGSVQMKLDTSQLPKPLQVNALTNSDWTLESEKYSWQIQQKQADGAQKP